MNKVVKTVKMVGSLAVSVGIGAVATNVLAATMPAGTGAVMKACIKVGTYAVSGLAATEAGRQFGKKVDLVNDIVEKTINDVKEEIEKEKAKNEEENKTEYEVKPEDVE